MNKAYIVEQIDGVSYRVRIPEYHKLRGTLGCTKDADLPIAYVCVSPGIFPSYEIGDVVWVSYENNLLGNPIIMGSLLVRESVNKGSAFFCDSLEVDGDTKLSKNTTIDELTWKNLAYLKNIGGIIDSLNSKLSSMIDINNNSSAVNLKLSWAPVKQSFHVEGEGTTTLYDVKILDKDGNFLRYANVESDGITVKNVPSLGRVTYYH